MNVTITYKRTRRLYRSFVRQFYLRSIVIYFIFLSILPVILCWGCTSVIIQLYGFFSGAGVVDLWYHLFVSLPIALLAAIGLIKLVKRAVKVKHEYTRVYESCPIEADNEIDVEVKIDDDGIGLGKEKVRWDEMTLGLATKDFYAFLSARPVLIGIPKYAVDAELGEYLKNKMMVIKERQKGKSRLRQDKLGCEQSCTEGSFDQELSKGASRRNTLLKCGAVWGALVVGCLAATFAFCGANSLLAEASASLAFVLLAAIVSALIGPLMIICVALVIFHVEGGTPTAICSLLLGSPLMYCALIWGFRRWWKTTSRLVKWVGWIAIVCYSALATYCLLYGGSTI